MRDFIQFYNFLYYVYLFIRLGICAFSIVFIYKQKYLQGYSNYTEALLGLTLLVLCIIAVNGDYWYYLRWFEGNALDEHIEPIWISIKEFLSWDYSLFRAVVWGVGIVVMSYLFDYCKVNKILSFYLFGAFYIVSFCYARAAIALVFLLFGFIHLYRSRQEYRFKTWRLLLFVSFSYVGVTLHRSMFLIIPALLLPLVVKLNRKSLITLIILFPLLSYLFNLIFPYLSELISENEYLGEQAINYLSLDYDKGSRFLHELYPRIPILLYFSIAMFRLYRQKLIPKHIVRLSTAAFFILYTCFLFATVSSANGITFFYRTFNMAYPFMIITIAYTMQYVRKMQDASLIFFVVITLMLLLEIRYFIFINPDVIYNQIMGRYLI